MKDCIFCKIINKEIPSEAIYNDENIYAFKDINPQAPIHILVVPKKHFSSIMELNDSAIFNELCSAIQKIVKKLNIESSGFRLVVNNGKDAGQLVEHLHFHILAGKKLSDKMA